VSTLGIGLIGYGAIGKVHILGYKSMSTYYDLGANDIKLVGVCTAHEDTGQRAKERNGFLYNCVDYRKLLDDRTIHIIDCTAPNYLHHAIVSDSIEKGKHVYCEKPLAMNVREAEDIVKKASKANVKCQIVFNYRFVPALIRAKQLIELGKLGKIINFRMSYLHSGYIEKKRPMSWRLRKSQSGGGALFDLGSHCLDLVLYLVGQCKSVFASMYTFVDSRPAWSGSDQMESVDVDDVAILQLVLKNGAVGTIEASRLSTGSLDELRIEIQGERGAIRFNLMDPNFLYFYNIEEKSDPFGGERGFKRIECMQRYSNSDLQACSRTSVGWQRFHLESQYRYIQSIINDSETEPNFNDALRVQQIMESAYSSAEQNRWVDLF
jgi:predicted dehydrogenase